VNVYETSNVYTAYPFKEDSPALNQVPADFLIDAVVSCPPTIEPPVGIHKITKSGVIYNITLKDGNGTTIIDGPLVLGATSTVGQVQTGGSFLKYIRGPAFNDFLNSLANGDTILSPMLEFETAAIHIRASMLEKLKVKGSEYSGNIAFESGYNINIRQNETSNIQSIISAIVGTANQKKGFIIEAGSGIGLGRVPNTLCEDSSSYDAVYKINNAQPEKESGRFIIEPGPCFRIEPYPNEHKLRIYNDCYACCDCETYRRLARILQDEIHTYWQARDILYDLVDQYNNKVKEYNAYIESRYGILITCAAMKAPKGETFNGGDMSSAKFYIKNMYPDTVENLTFSITRGPSVVESWHKKIVENNTNTGRTVLGGSFGSYTLKPKEQVEWAVLFNGVASNTTVSVNYRYKGENKSTSKTFSW